ncbi:MAG: hypothetical protein EBU49_11160, partial [Proteobacteria bacterium]|nr:hypothetical protein [Pseudomonadota bacterium]
MNKNKISPSPQTSVAIQVSAWTPLVEPDDSALEAALRWPERTLGWLRAAFVSGARRQTAWNLGDLGTADARAVAKAATVFRRGVETISDTISDAVPAKTSGVKPGYKPLVLQASPSVKSVLEGIFSEFSGRESLLFFAIDAAVAKSWPAVAQLSGKFPVWIFKGGEPAKNLASTAAVLAQVGAHLKSHTEIALEDFTITAIGGGVTLDLAGFAAGLLGCRHINIPTTLLAMVDAAVGGKTGVNFEPWGKNQVGLFHFPERVFVCPEFLQTLPGEEVRAGGAECLKHALLAEDFPLLEKWAEFLREPVLTNASHLETTSMITAVAKMKEDFVQLDPFERAGKRELLNLGHTIAHSLEGVETVLRKRQPSSGLRHGSAVAFGLMCKIHLMVAAQPEAAETAGKIMECLNTS